MNNENNNNDNNNNELYHIISLISTGSIMGIIHVLAGVDHLSALATLSVGSSWRAIKLGIRWGLGHSAGLILVTIIFLLLKGEVNINIFKKYCDSLVGLFMIILGIHSIYNAIKTYKNNNNNNSNNYNNNNTMTSIQFPLNHYQTSSSSSLSTSTLSTSRLIDIEKDLYDSKDINKKNENNIYFDNNNYCNYCLNTNMKDSTTQRLVAFIIGIVHGIAGPGGMLGVVPAVEMKNWHSSTLYLTSFTISSTLCMGIFAAIFGEITKRAGSTSGYVELLINIFSSLLSIIVGFIWILLSSMGKLEEIFE